MAQVPELPRGAQVGRYLVLEPLGMGGAGVVYAAYDPELDRKVAVKLLRADAVDDAARVRLVREAQAIARLAHPNVVAVFDAGTWDGRLFLAMELVDGGTLTSWLEDKGRSWREVRDVFVQAGRGLAAAHAAGLVHRDFKPSNVLLGRDGRVRVGDFGLARPVQSSDGDTLGAHAALLDVTVTQPGDLLGTPAYMAPEQHQRRPADARSDQFSFCVALYEALYRRRPFQPAAVSPEDSTAQTAMPPLMALAAEVLSGRVREPPAGSVVPASVHKVILRGLSASAERRYPSMDALLADLGRDRGPLYRRTALALGIAAAAALAGFALGPGAASAGPHCERSADRAGDVWGARQRAALAARFAGTGHPRAAEATSLVAGIVERYTRDWSAMRIGACEATRRGEQSAALLDLRMRCLDRRLDEMAGTVELIGRDRNAVNRAVEAVSSVTAISGCSDIDALTATVPPPADPARASWAQRLAGELDRAKAHYRAGLYRDGLQQVTPLVEAARKLDHAPLLADALFWQAELAERSGDLDTAARALGDALPAAARGFDDRALAEVLIAQVWLHGKRGQLDRALAVKPMAEAAILRASSPDDLRGRLLHYLAGAMADHDRNAEAIALHGEALSIRERIHGPRDLEVAATLNNLAIQLKLAGKTARAIELLQRARSIYEQWLGPGHPTVATTILNLGTVIELTGDLDEAARHYQAALAIRAAVLPADDPAIASAHYVLGNLAFTRGRFEDAAEHLERCVAIRRAALGDQAVKTAEAEMALADALNVLDRSGEALRLAEHALATMNAHFGADSTQVVGPLQSVEQVHRRRKEWDAAAAIQVRIYEIRKKSYGPGHLKLGVPLVNMADIDAERGRCDRALPRYREVMALWKGQLPDDHAYYGYLLTGLGSCLVSLGRAAAAREPLARALAIRERGGDTPDLARTRFALARALSAPGGDGGRALELAEQAETGFARAGHLDEQRAAVTAWLRAHR